MGEKLPNIGQAEDVARSQQQSVHDETVMNYILKLEVIIFLLHSVVMKTVFLNLGLLAGKRAPAR